MPSSSTLTVEAPAREAEKVENPAGSRFPSPQPVEKPAPFVIKLAGSVPN
ncbi:MAG: hypothetical protein ACRD1B_08755 [Thermoanaerobaculia bacterium]